MTFAEKLSLLTGVYKISNSRLARAIHVDTSLVSRWKTGERIPSALSPHIAAVASFFVQTDAYPYQRAYLDKLLAVLLREHKDADQQTRIHALASWLTSGDARELPDMPERMAISADGPDQLVGSIRQAVSGAAGPQPVLPSGSQAGWSEAVQPGTPAQSMLYRGLDGRRQAVVNLLQSVLGQDETCELLLVSEEPMDWLLGDPAFTRHWASLMLQMIRRGHQITVIHIVNRQSQDIALIVDYWLPLHLAGHMQSFYKPHYDDPAIRQSLFIVRNRLACRSLSSGPMDGQCVTEVSQDPVLVEHMTQVYAGYLSQCLPLLKAYGAHNAAELARELETWRSQRLITLSQHLNIDCLPARTTGRLAALHGDALPAQNQSAAMVIDLVPDALLEDILSQGAVIGSDCTLFLDQPFQLDPAESAEWLLTVATALRTRKDYELYLYPASDAAALGCSLACYENQAALFAPLKASRAFTILLQERNALYSLSLYLDRFITRIPTSQRSKPDVIRRLERTAELLQQKHEHASSAPPVP